MNLKVVLGGVVAAGICCGSAGGAVDAPWPQFRGPAGTGIAENDHPPTEIGVDSHVKWKVPAPAGLSSPIIVGDLLVLTAFEDEKLWTIAYRRADGSEAWRAEAPYQTLEPFHPTEGSPAASTPATDGERIVSYFGSCGLFCYDLQGEELWKLEMPAAATVADFGSGVSPVIADGLVVLLRDEMTQPKIMAVDAATGKPRWEKPRTSIAGFGTPAIVEGPNGKLIVAPGFGRLVAYDLSSGEEAWFVNGMPSCTCTTPVCDGKTAYFAGWSPGVSDDDQEYKMPSFDELLAGDANKDGVFQKQEAAATDFAGFFDNNDPNKDGAITRDEWQQTLDFMAAGVNSAFAVALDGKGDMSESVRWRNKEGLPYVPSAILVNGQYLMVKNGGIVTSYDAASGERIYQRRAASPGDYYASPVVAGDHVYLATLADGAITVLKLAEGRLETVAKNDPLGERLSATPAIADDTLYVRTAGHLWAFGE